jgi:hypothetical protein
MLGHGQSPISAQAGKYGIADFWRKRAANPENGRLSATDVRWINCRPVPRGSARPPLQKERYRVQRTAASDCR